MQSILKQMKNVRICGVHDINRVEQIPKRVQISLNTGEYFFIIMMYPEKDWLYMKLAAKSWDLKF